MKLYELPQGQLFKLKADPQTAPASARPLLEKTYKLHNIDGMYSYVTDENNKVYHFVAWTEVEMV